MGLMEGKRDKKIIELYTLLSHSDFEGNYEDTYVIEVLFALMCVDLNSKRIEGLDLKRDDILTLAKELVRIVEINEELSIYSFYNWSSALCKYMVDKGKSVTNVHKESTYDLRENVSEYLEKEE